MAKSNNAFIKKQKEAIKRKKKLEKAEKKKERKENSKGGDLENMLVYVDEYGNFSTEPPKNFPLGSVTKIKP
ncbi:MAG: cold-shock protein [Cytophagales bacterium]|nr:cold-shock protein [Cytophagales bacterium]